MFADMWPAGAPNRVYDVGNDEKVVDLVIDDSVEISSLNPNSGSLLDIVFSIPSAETYFNNAQVGTEAVIILKQVSSGDQRTIRVDQISGRINIE